MQCINGDMNKILFTIYIFVGAFILAAALSLAFGDSSMVPALSILFTSPALYSLFTRRAGAKAMAAVVSAFSGIVVYLVAHHFLGTTSASMLMAAGTQWAIITTRLKHKTPIMEYLTPAKEPAKPYEF